MWLKYWKRKIYSVSKELECESKIITLFNISRSAWRRQNRRKKWISRLNLYTKCMTTSRRKLIVKSAFDILMCWLEQHVESKISKTDLSSMEDKLFFTYSMNDSTLLIFFNNLYMLHIVCKEGEQLQGQRNVLLLLF